LLALPGFLIDRARTANMGAPELYIEDEWREVLCAEGLDDFGVLMSSRRGKGLSYHTRSQVYRIELRDGKVVFLKRDVFTLTMLKDTLFDVLRLRRPEPPCVKEWNALLAVRRAGISAPEPIAFGQRRRTGLPYQGVLVTAMLQGTPLSKLLVSNSDEDLRLSAVRAAGQTVRMICEAGLSWCDMVAKHFFVSERKAGILDLARMEGTPRAMKSYAPKQVRRFITDLRRCGATETEVEAFLDAFGHRDVIEF